MAKNKKENKVEVVEEVKSVVEEVVESTPETEPTTEEVVEAAADTTNATDWDTNGEDGKLDDTKAEQPQDDEETKYEGKLYVAPKTTVNYQSSSVLSSKAEIMPRLENRKNCIVAAHPFEGTRTGRLVRDCSKRV